MMLVVRFGRVQSILPRVHVVSWFIDFWLRRVVFELAAGFGICRYVFEVRILIS